MTATCRWCATTVVSDGELNDMDLVRKMDAHRCPPGVQAWLFVPDGAVNCEDCGHVWPTGAHLTELLQHACPPELGLAVGPDAICAECGNDEAAEGLPFCMDCLEANPGLLP